MDKNEKILRELAPEGQLNYIPIGRNSLQMGIVNKHVLAWTTQTVYDFTPERLQDIANEDICYMKVGLERQLLNSGWSNINPQMRALSRSTDRFDVLYTMPEMKILYKKYRYRFFDGVIISDLIRGARMAMGSPYDLAVAVIRPEVTKRILRHHDSPILAFRINWEIYGFFMPCSKANEDTPVYTLPTIEL